MNATAYRTFADYAAAEWMTVRRDERGWYILSDVDWCIRKMKNEGWKVKRTGERQIMPDDDIRTYVEVAV